jgi:hypothetical protein
MVALRDTLNEWDKKQVSDNISMNRRTSDSKVKLDNSHLIKKQRNINETVELVSQYVIINQIGYPIEISSSGQGNKKLVYKIPNL